MERALTINNGCYGITKAQMEQSTLHLYEKIKEKFTCNLSQGLFTIINIHLTNGKEATAHSMGAWECLSCDGEHSTHENAEHLIWRLHLYQFAK